MDPLKVLLVDDHALFRQGVESLLATRPDIEVVGSVGDGFEAISVARETIPDVILMDIEMPRCNGLEATRQISRELPKTKIVVLTVVDDDETVFEAIKCGAQGYLLKDLEAYQLFDMLDGIRKGDAPLSGGIAAKILAEFTHPEPLAAAEHRVDEELSDRERQVLSLLVEGKTNKEIADILIVTENTVKTHLTNILTKLHLQNRIQAAVYAVRQGLVDGDTRRDPGDNHVHSPK
jgi:two-component system, NarL family, nitrate/nitrite response regulator NarL